MMKRMLLLGAIALLSVAASATSLTAGNSVSAVDLGTANPPYTVLADTGIIHYSLTGAGGTLTGSLVEHVDQDASGNIVFVYGFTVDSGSTDLAGIEHLTAASFGGFTTDVGYASGLCITEFCPNVGDTAPVTINRSAGPGDTLSFNFSGVQGGHQSFDLIVVTNATSWQVGSISLIDSGSYTNANVFAPSVPEPASLTLLASGLAFVIRRRFRK